MLSRISCPSGARHRLAGAGCSIEPAWRWTVLVVLAWALIGCTGADQNSTQVEVPGTFRVEGVTKTVALQRAERRAYDGAPPIIPHESFGSPCVSCHNEEGVAVPNVGFAPPSPHEATEGLSAISYCRQCHVFQQASEPFDETTFRGFRQDLRRGKRLFDGAPPIMPHAVFMRENCRACHSGPAAREEIRTTHPERPLCEQCHVEQKTTSSFLEASLR